MLQGNHTQFARQFGFDYFARVDPSATAVVDSNGREWSRGSIRDLAEAIAQSIRGSGVQEGDCVAIILQNRAEYLAVYFGGLWAGVQVVPINWHLSSSEVEFILEDSGARAVFVDSRVEHRIHDVIRSRRSQLRAAVSLGAVSDHVELADFVASHRDTPFAATKLGRPMAYTSATTGVPKGVRLPEANSEAALERAVRWNLSLGVDLGPEDAHLCCSMLYHTAPMNGTVTALHMGHRVVVMDKWAPEAILEAIQKHRITSVFMVPSMFVALLKLPSAVRSRYDLSSLRYVLHGGAPCAIAVKEAMLDWLGPIIWESYGATEVQGTAVSSRDWLRHPGTVGKPMLESRVKILGEDGRELGRNKVGRVFMTPYSGDRFEYHRDPEKTLLSYDGDYIFAGDIGYLNDEGYLFLSGRESELILSSGMNIYPREIEDVLIQHPAVTDCAVIGVPHPLCGQVPKAFVVLSSDAAPETELRASLLQLLAKFLSASKMPKYFEFVRQIPRDPNGKLFRRKLIPQPVSL